MKPLGIRNRILLAALAPAVLVAVLVSGMLVVEQLEQTQVDQHRRLAALARQLSASAEYSLFVGNDEGLLKLLNTALDEPDVVGAAILSIDGKVLASTVPSHQLPPLHATLDGFAMAALAEEKLHWHRFTIRSRSLAEPDLFSLMAPPEPPPLGNLLLQISNQSLHDEAWRHVMKAAGLSLLMLGLGMLLAMALSRVLIRTLTSIGRIVDNITHGRHHQRIENISNDELGELAQGINTMADAVAETQEHLALRIAEATATLRRERDEAAQAALSRSRFFAAASHDLRQPVQALGLFAARLERDARASPLRAGVQQLGKSVRTLQGLLDTLLDYSRLDGQVFRVDVRPVHAADFLSHLHAEFGAAAAEKGLYLRLHVNDCWLMTDRSLLHRILINLVSNAIRYTTRGAILIACRHGTTHARIEIWDTGPGIPPEQQASIFDELVQLDNPERDSNKGLGLGLAIVRRIAELLDHPVQLKSRQGKGSCFSVIIPLANVPAESVAESTAAEHAGTDFILLGAGLDDVATMLDGWELEYQRAQNCMDIAKLAAPEERRVVVICTTDGDVENCVVQLDRLDAVFGLEIPALLIHPGPQPALDTGSPARILLARPFRPARLRALLDYLVDPGD